MDVVYFIHVYALFHLLQIQLDSSRILTAKCDVVDHKRIRRWNGYERYLANESVIEIYFKRLQKAHFWVILKGLCLVI